MRYSVNIVMRRKGGAPDSKLQSKRLVQAFPTIEEAVAAAEVEVDRSAGRASLVTIRVLEGARSVYLSERDLP